MNAVNRNWLQFTNNTSGTGPADGFRIGLSGQVDNAQINQMEDSPIDIFTNSGPNNSRRIRISHDNTTNEPRIGIGELVTNPRTYLHIGNNQPNNSGWRDWMNVGTLYTVYNDNMYVGLREIATDRCEAIINWGNNPADPNFPGIQDRLRFVFTARPGPYIASNTLGLEAGRIITDGNRTNWGVGDFLTVNANPKRQLDVLFPSYTGLVEEPQFRITRLANDNIALGVYADFYCTGSGNSYAPNNSGTGGHLLINPRKDGDFRTVAINFENGSTSTFAGLALDVNGQQNIRTVDNDDNLTQVLVWDPNNEGRIMWRDASTLGGGGSIISANNGLHINALTNEVYLGGQLVEYTNVKLNNFNLDFSDPSSPTSGMNRIRIGNIVNPTVSKLTVDNTNEASTAAFRSNSNNVIDNVLVYYNGSSNVNRLTGLKSTIVGGVTMGNDYNIAVEGNVKDGNARYAIAISGDVHANPSYPNGENYGGRFLAQDFAGTNYGIMCYAGDANTNYGVYSTVSQSTTATNYAGWFNGDVHSTGDITEASDLILKENIIGIENALQKIDQLQPVSFNYKVSQFPGMNLPSGINYGLIAQDVILVLPDLVNTIYKPIERSSDGTLISDSLTYKGIDYTEFVPILIQGEKELIRKNDSLENRIINLESRLSDLESMFISCCSQSKSASVDVTIQNRPLTIPSNGNSLGQNYPNPFRTVTTFTYTIANNGFVEFVIDDSYGKEVARLVNENKTAGTYGMEWEPQLPAGIYFYSLKVNGEVLVKKAVKIE